MRVVVVETMVSRQEELMKRLFSAPLLVLLATGCGSREGEFKPSGQPALVEPPSQEGRGPKRLAILLDGKVVSAPQVKEELSNGRIWIHEDSEAEARKTAKGIVNP
jgi:hypothetical protein